MHPCQGANSNKVSNAARAAMRMWGTRPETLQENARDRSRHTTLISCHVASHRNLWETLHIIFINLLFHSVTAWFLCTTWPFQTCISASTIHLFYFGLQVIGSTAICPFLTGNKITLSQFKLQGRKMVHQVPDNKCWNWQDEQWSQQKQMLLKEKSHSSAIPRIKWLKYGRYTRP